DLAGAINMTAKAVNLTSLFLYVPYKEAFFHHFHHLAQLRQLTHLSVEFSLQSLSALEPFSQLDDMPIDNLPQLVSIRHLMLRFKAMSHNVLDSVHLSHLFPRVENVVICHVILRCNTCRYADVC